MSAGRPTTAAGASPARRTFTPGFDASYYLESNPDLSGKCRFPLLHYLRHGAREGRLPAPPFNTREFLDKCRRHFHQSWPHEPAYPTSPYAADIKLIAFFLPQYHRIPENDQWWGDGFTEWTSVKRGYPQYAGHPQPEQPHDDLGYYDLSDPATLEKQADMARAFGLHGFCYYYYWFDGHRLLEKPLETMLQSRRPDFPFCLCWANENWTRRWDGQDREILIAQRHSAGDDVAFITSIIPYLRDSRYIRLDGRPLLLIYRPHLLPNPRETVQRWREVCRQAGIGEIHVAGVMVFGLAHTAECGLDSLVQFAGHDASLQPINCEEAISPDFQGRMLSYLEVRRNMLLLQRNDINFFRGVMPGWDNTPRCRERATIFMGSSPQAYYEWLRGAIEETRKQHAPRNRFIFANAWNEWGEGCHLEPDKRLGYANLNATARALADAHRPRIPFSAAQWLWNHYARKRFRQRTAQP